METLYPLVAPSSSEEIPEVMPAGNIFILSTPLSNKQGTPFVWIFSIANVALRAKGPILN
jgi:hypothetical protein